MAVYGFWLSLGRGGLQDHAAGFHWLETAADRGVKVAHFGLAAAYGAGNGVQRDPAQAVVHLLIAGISEDIPKASLEALQADLTREQLDEVQKAVSGWRPARGN